MCKHTPIATVSNSIDRQVMTGQCQWLYSGFAVLIALHFRLKLIIQ